MAASDKYKTKEELSQMPVRVDPGVKRSLWDGLGQSLEAVANNSPELMEAGRRSVMMNPAMAGPAALYNYLSPEPNKATPTTYERMTEDELDLWRNQDKPNSTEPPEQPSLQDQLEAYFRDNQSNFAAQVRAKQGEFVPLEAPQLQAQDTSEYDEALRARLGERSDRTDFSPLMGLIDSWHGTNLSQSYNRPQEVLDRQNQKDLALYEQLNRLGAQETDIANKNTQLQYDTDKTNRSLQQSRLDQELKAMGQDARSNTQIKRSIIKAQGEAGVGKKGGKINGYTPKQIDDSIANVLDKANTESTINEIIQMSQMTDQARLSSGEITEKDLRSSEAKYNSYLTLVTDNVYKAMREDPELSAQQATSAVINQLLLDQTKLAQAYGE